MPQFEWKDTLRIVVGEITRKQQMALWAEISAMEAGTANLEQLQRTSEALAALATRAVFVRQGKQWVKAEGGAEADYEGDCIAFNLPVTAQTFGDLPVSLADGWIAKAVEANGGLDAVLNFTSLIPMASLNGSGMASEPEPPIAP